MAKKNITITISIEELRYDIQTTTWQTAEARKADGNDRQVAQMKVQEEDNDTIMRIISSAVANAVAAVAEYLIDVEWGNGSSDALRSEGDVEIHLAMPGNFNDNMVYAISQNMHAYLLYTSLVDWYKMKAPDEMTVYSEKAAAALQTMRDALYKRIMPTRNNQ